MFTWFLLLGFVVAVLLLHGGSGGGRHDLGSNSKGSFLPYARKGLTRVIVPNGGTSAIVHVAHDIHRHSFLDRGFFRRYLLMVTCGVDYVTPGCRFLPQCREVG